jgi:fructokinase
MDAPQILVVGELIADAVVMGDGADGELSAPSVVVTAPDGLERVGAEGPPGPGSTGALRLMVRPGGSPANAAVGLARLGVAVGFVGRLSSSGLGPWLAAHLTGNGVDVRHSVVVGEAPTLAIVALDAAGMASYSFYGADTADWQWRPEELPRTEELTVAAVHTGSLATAVAPGAAALAGWIEEIHARGGVLISYDPNVRPSRIADAAAFTERARSLVCQAHLVKVGDGDMAFMYPHADPLEVARSWAAEGPELVVLTRGPREAVAFRADGSRVVGPAPSGPVVDTVGAGDAYSAALLAWLSEAGALHPGGLVGLDAEELTCALDLAGRAAGVTCARAGADPPHRFEVADGPWPSSLRIAG